MAFGRASVKRSLRAFRRDQRGAVAVWAVLIAPPLLGVAALAVDLSRIYSAQAEMQTAADALARAGALELDGSSGAITRANLAINNLVANDQRFSMPATRAGSWSTACASSARCRPTMRRRERVPGHHRSEPASLRASHRAPGDADHAVSAADPGQPGQHRGRRPGGRRAQPAHLPRRPPVHLQSRGRHRHVAAGGAGERHLPGPPAVAARQGRRLRLRARHARLPRAAGRPRRQRAEADVRRGVAGLLLRRRRRDVAPGPGLVGGPGLQHPLRHLQGQLQEHRGRLSARGHRHLDPQATASTRGPATAPATACGTSRATWRRTTRRRGR